jgi:hypothetical protein
MGGSFLFAVSRKLRAREVKSLLEESPASAQASGSLNVGLRLS